jgi:hypothetical protein
VTLPAAPLTALWQSTVADVEPSSRLGHRYDGVSMTTSLVVANESDVPLEFPLILATTDPEERSVRVDGDALDLRGADPDTEWDALAAAIRANAAGQGYSPARIELFLTKLRAVLRHAAKSEVVRVEPGQRRFVRSYQRKLLSARGDVFELRGLFPLPQFALAKGGGVSVVVLLPKPAPDVRAELVGWSEAGTTQAFGSQAGLPNVGGRLALAWSTAADPELAVSYRYATSDPAPAQRA